MTTCEHRKQTNFAVSRDSVQHLYCPDCGWHLYKGREYTKSEWHEVFIAEQAAQGELFGKE